MKLVYLAVMMGLIACFNPAAYAKNKLHKAKKAQIVRKIRPSTRVLMPPIIYGTAQLVNSLNYIISDSGHSKADVAVYVKSMKYNDALYAHNINQPMTPASTLKILTAEAALIYLGPDYRFSTQLLTDAKGVKSGILQGNLYVVFSGDPSLTYNDIVELLLTLRNQQIQAIAGNVYIDSTAYDQRFYGPGWEWKDRQYSYAAPISASIINHNYSSFAVTPSKIIYHSGQVVTDVPEYNRSLFKNSLSRLGITVYGHVTFGSAPENLSLVGQHASKPLHVLINDMLKKSDNIIAGALFKKIGQLYSHQPGSWENGSLAVRRILSKNAGVNTTGMKILDGSGLSSNNLVSPAQMMKVLEFAYHHYPTSYDFITALPIAGVDGTLKHRMWNIARKVRAKTGSLVLTGVISLAGYATSNDNEPLAFVVMINGYKGMSSEYKSIEDRVATALTRYRRS